MKPLVENLISIHALNRIIYTFSVVGLSLKISSLSSGMPVMDRQNECMNNTTDAINPLSLCVCMLRAVRLMAAIISAKAATVSIAIMKKIISYKPHSKASYSSLSPS